MMMSKVFSGVRLRNKKFSGSLEGFLSMKKGMKVIVISGSLRVNSRNRAVAKKAVELGSEVDLEVVYHDISELPLYNEDLEKDYPSSVVQLREAVQRAEGLLLVTPENNHLPSAPMKNAFDWLSRGGAEGTPLRNKKIAIISAGGRMGGLLAQDALRGALKIMQKNWLPVTILEEPVFTLNVFVPETFDESGALIEPTAIENLRKVLQSFV
jgi:chromate reductase